MAFGHSYEYKVAMAAETGTTTRVSSLAAELAAADRDGWEVVSHSLAPSGALPPNSILWMVLRRRV